MSVSAKVTETTSFEAKPNLEIDSDAGDIRVEIADYFAAAVLDHAVGGEPAVKKGDRVEGRGVVCVIFHRYASATGSEKQHHEQKRVSPELCHRHLSGNQQTMQDVTLQRSSEITGLETGPG